ncbi:hypothetical protein G9G63_09235 [Paenibacillus sp. EKM202P]|uniref:hypothetical protein n=1 Tax=unclassified Paenibacillus TaxID=185978 RepID=UPI0013EC9E7E|nr:MULTISPECIES: hypothetical protein [unclassified Paenibacillus]KAF6565333.1 hypothetical protein G9G63_09235 [Paenibacillus sp. EKM202P]KAF6569341.1 hypothetical protein G9G64_12855 [Paenibacillus sp. EKM207P]
MQLYQFWWEGSYEGDNGEPLAHESVFTREELVEMVKESGNRYDLSRLEEFLIENKGFFKPNCIRINTENSLG